MLFNWAKKTLFLRLIIFTPTLRGLLGKSNCIFITFANLMKTFHVTTNRNNYK